MNEIQARQFAKQRAAYHSTQQILRKQVINGREIFLLASYRPGDRGLEDFFCVVKP